MKKPISPVVAAVIIVVVIAVVIFAYTTLEKSAKQSDPHKKDGNRGGISLKMPAGEVPAGGGEEAGTPAPSAGAETGQ